MVDRAHLAHLLSLKGDRIEIWNRWRAENPEIKPDLSGLNSPNEDFYQLTLRGADLSGANLSGAELNYMELNDVDFSNANLSGASFDSVRASRANFSGADLSGADFSNAILDSAILCEANLRGAKFDKANLCGALIYRTNLKEVRFSDANLSETDLHGADLSNANLDNANLIDADLSGANLRKTFLVSANLSGANLTGAYLNDALLATVRALGTRFDRAELTGACIQDWSINFSTSLQGVECDYIFNKADYKNDGWQFSDRRPHDTKRNFAAGEFTKRYQKVLETVELFFEDGVNWKALLASMQDFQAEYGGELPIQEMRQGAGGGFGLALGLPPELDKGAVERWLHERYDKLQLVEAEHRAEIKALNKEHKEEMATARQQHDNQMLEMVTVFVNSASTNNSNSISLAVNTAQVQQNAVIAQQSNNAKTEEKPPENKSKWNRVIVIAGLTGTCILGLLGWAVNATDHLQTISEKWGIDIPGLVDSAGPDQSPSPPSP